MPITGTIARLNGLTGLLTRAILTLVRLFATAIGAAVVISSIIRQRLIAASGTGAATVSGSAVRVRLIAQAEAAGAAVCLATDERFRDMFALASGIGGATIDAVRQRLLAMASASGSASSTASTMVRARVNDGTAAGDATATATMTKYAGLETDGGVALVSSDGNMLSLTG